VENETQARTPRKESRRQFAKSGVLLAKKLKKKKMAEESHKRALELKRLTLLKRSGEKFVFDLLEAAGKSSSIRPNYWPRALQEVSGGVSDDGV